MLHFFFVYAQPNHLSTMYINCWWSWESINHNMYKILLFSLTHCA